MDPAIEKKLLQLSRRQRYKKKKRWYCRYSMFKHAFETWQLENVEEMTAEQYTEALEAVHDYLQNTPHIRKFWKLDADAGPSDVSERSSEKALYSGAPTRYKNYSYRVLTYFVQALQPDTNPLTCSERTFEEALRLTNERCKDLFRGLSRAAFYQGPQCFAERDKNAKFLFDPSDAPQTTRRSTRYSDGSFLVLQCTEASCGKWRRVDDATHDLFFRQWLWADRQARRDALCEHIPHIAAELHKLLREQLAVYYGQYYGKKRTKPFRLDAARLHHCLETNPLCQDASKWNMRSF